MHLSHRILDNNTYGACTNLKPQTLTPATNCQQQHINFPWIKLHMLQHSKALQTMQLINSRDYHTKHIAYTVGPMISHHRIIFHTPSHNDLWTGNCTWNFNAHTYAPFTHFCTKSLIIFFFRNVHSSCPCVQEHEIATLIDPPQTSLYKLSTFHCLHI